MFDAFMKNILSTAKENRASSSATVFVLLSHPHSGEGKSQQEIL